MSQTPPPPGMPPPPGNQPPPPGAPPPGGPPPGQQPAGVQKPASNLVWAILTTLFCCLPFGVVSIVFAARVDSAFANGDYAGAESASQNAKRWAIFSALAAIILWILGVFFIVVIGVSLPDTTTY